MRGREHCSSLYTRAQVVVNVLSRNTNACVCLCVFLQNLTSKDKEYVTRLTLLNVTEEDEGQYWCTGSNFLGKSEIPFWLTVRHPGKPPPRILTEAPNQLRLITFSFWVVVAEADFFTFLTQLRACVC